MGVAIESQRGKWFGVVGFCALRRAVECLLEAYWGQGIIMTSELTAVVLAECTNGSWLVLIEGPCLRQWRQASEFNE